jgi:pilus assembly protein CpaC
MKNLMTLLLTISFLLPFGAIACPTKDKCGEPTLPAAMEVQKPRKINYNEVLTLGKAQTVQIDGDIADVIVANPNVIEVGSLQNNKLYIVGSNLGDTNILVFDAAGDTIAKINVHVRIDEFTMKNTLTRLFPKENVSVDTVGDDIIVTGDVSNASVAANIENVINRFIGENNEIVNMMSVKGDQQVMIKVKVIEIKRSILNEIGIDTDILPGNTSTVDGGFLTNSEFGLNPLRSAFGLTSTSPFGLGSLIWDPSGFNPISFMISALDQDQLVNTLAEPNLTAKSGENARFLAGGEIPVVADRNDDRVTFEYRPFGVVLSFRPLVLDENRISLQISTEVSEISTEASTVVAGVPFPSFDVRRAETSVEMASGGSLMIAGLVKSQTINNLAGIPGLKDTPILGELSKSDSFKRDESELIIMISAYLINPTAADDYKDAQAAKKNDNNRNDNPILRNVLSSNLRQGYDTIPAWTGHETQFGYMLD